MRITVLSDTHTRHGLIPLTDLPGGDILICRRHNELRIQ